MGHLSRLPGQGARFAAVLSASVKFLYADFLDTASDESVAQHLECFYDACIQPPLHRDLMRRRIGFLRHGLAHLLHSQESISARLENCLAPRGPYHLPGLGPAFWSALVQGLQPERLPAWTADTVAGLKRLGLADWERTAGPGAIYTALCQVYWRIQALERSLTALHVDHFLCLVAHMQGRNLWQQDPVDNTELWQAALQRERARQPLRQRLKERGQALAGAHELLEQGLACCDGQRIGAALAEADPLGFARTPLKWKAHGETLTLWVGRLWEADDPYATLHAFWEADPLPGAGIWLPAAVLHLRDAQRYQPWNEAVRRGYALLDDSTCTGMAPAAGYRLFNEGVHWLRQHRQIHPLEMADLLASLATTEEYPGSEMSLPARPQPGKPVRGPVFGGFCADTFRFLAELADNNCREWMEKQRPRYQFAVRQPLVELCRALECRYVEPVLRGTHGWNLVSGTRPGRALTSICKNSYGRSAPYNTTLWIAFCQQAPGGGREEVQLFVCLEAGGLSCGLRLGRKARPAIARFRQHVQSHAEMLYRLLADHGVLATCRFGPAGDQAIGSPGDLREWAKGKSFEISRHFAPDSPLLQGDELVGETLLLFDRLLPAFACAVERDPRPFLLGRLGGRTVGEPYREGDFHQATFLPAGWLRQARVLLDLKRQLILQGVPGTGKTHVARCLAQLLTCGREGAVRLVQFHPSYTYEEFVEGIRVKSVAVEGRHDVTYPVEDGLLCSFAAEAASQPGLPFVLVIDEINRGNLPRIFGELLYLLEYREQVVGLPYSRRGFRLPANLYLLATMNAADRSAVHLDQALRRRFSFLEMTPDTEVLSAWFQAHPPAGGRNFAERVVGLFERLNSSLALDVGPTGLIGHSFFMCPGLDEDRLAMIWQHQVWPLLEGSFAGRPERLREYQLEHLLNPRRATGRKKQTSKV